MTLRLLIDRVTHQAEFDLRDVHILKVVNELIMPTNRRLRTRRYRPPRLKRAACSSDGVLSMLGEVLLASWRP